MISSEKEMLDNILRTLDSIEFISSADLPNIDLYMDQVTTFMDENLKSAKRYEDDKILTKTMINNYTKNHLLPSPLNKKYSKEHMLILLFIYYFKGFLSLSDIQSLMKPLTDHFFHSKDGITIEQIYNDARLIGAQEAEHIRSDVLRTYDSVCSFYTDREQSEAGDGEHDPFLQIFTMITMLSFDVYVKKQIIEKLIDSIT